MSSGLLTGFLSIYPGFTTSDVHFVTTVLETQPSYRTCCRRCCCCWYRGSWCFGLYACCYLDCCCCQWPSCYWYWFQWCWQWFFCCWKWLLCCWQWFYCRWQWLYCCWQCCRLRCWHRSCKMWLGARWRQLRSGGVWGIWVPIIIREEIMWMCTLFQISVLTTSHALLIRHLGETF